MKPIQPAPFAAKIDFKPNCLFQKRHSQWTFKSTDILGPNVSNALVHLQVMENLIFKELKGSFICASLFDNRPKNISKYDFTSKPNPLILQVLYDKIRTDRRTDLDLTFLHPTFNPDYLNALFNSFEPLEDNGLQVALQNYKTALNL